jgi:penicillin-binding protein 2
MRNKGFILVILTIISGLLFIGRLFYLQIIDDSFRSNPLNNAAVRAKYDYPRRGYIYDRNNKLLVANQTSYDIMVIPNEIKNLDTLEFCKILSISKDDFQKKVKKARSYSSWLPSIFLQQLSKGDYAILQEKMFRFKGFYIQKRMLREYPYNSAANVLGYISQVNEKMAKENPYYQSGELIGYQGVEKYYEKDLRGIKGVKYIKRNILNKEIGSYKNGKYDTLSVAGKDLKLTLDIDLQQYGEWLLHNKRGGIVALEPKTGEILALITAPGYNPGLMVGRDRSKNFNKLYLDKINKPLFDRSLQAQYSPGSTFKMLNGLIALQEEVITTHTTTRCYGGYRYGVRAEAFMGCHCHTFGKPMKLEEAIYKSCNTYFSTAYRRAIEKYPTAAEGMNNWSKRVKKFGLGNYLGYDLPVGQKGLIPDAAYYDRYYPMKNWKAATTISNAIGQGEILTTPIQLANMTSAIANRGYYFTPHIVKEIDNKPIDNPKFTIPKETGINTEYFEPVIDGMQLVFEKKGGTAYYSQIKGIEICGKTGTVENFIRRDGEKIQLADHSIFIAFAPKDDPKIAIAVFVENGGFGSRIAAPIASLMIEKYLNKSIQNEWREKNVHDINLFEEQYNKQLELLQPDEAQ